MYVLDRNMKAKKPYNCGIGPAFEVIGGKWKAKSSLWELHVQPHGASASSGDGLPGDQRERC
jgi:hypothetical protein